LNLYPVHIGGTVVQVLVTVFSDETRRDSSRLAAELRAAGINTELYMEDKNLGRQFKHADRKGIPLVAVLGPDEIANGAVNLKRLNDGTEITVERGSAGDKARELLA
jgi:histidyl-tRNA synthetase